MSTSYHTTNIDVKTQSEGMRLLNNPKQWMNECVSFLFFFPLSPDTWPALPLNPLVHKARLSLRRLLLRPPNVQECVFWPVARINW